MAEGLTDRGIAERLYVTPKTVETHIRHVFEKLEIPRARSTTSASTPCSRICERRRID
jgi:DNA-binding NarL/FixJ family response regulator